jgi:ATP-dependent RNA helicase DHX36
MIQHECRVHANRMVIQTVSTFHQKMLRVGLEDLALQVLILDLGEPSEFLARAMNPPSALAMRNSLKLLEQLGALECTWGEKNRSPIPSRSSSVVETESCASLSVSSELTALGFHLAMLPVEPRVGKMMIYGALFGCVEPALTIAVSVSPGLIRPDASASSTI